MQGSISHVRAIHPTAVLQLIRLIRNDAGHPTGRQIDREDAFNHLAIYARANKRLYALMRFFKGA